MFPSETWLVPARPVSTGGGIAKFLPVIVPVKRETPWVVSSTMAGLVRGWWICFPQEGFMRRSQLWGRDWMGGVCEQKRLGDLGVSGAKARFLSEWFTRL